MATSIPSAQISSPNPTLPQGFVSAAPPTNVIYASNTTLFTLAELYLGNALLWPIIAAVNPGQKNDPWIFGNATINIPTNVPQILTLNPSGIRTP